MAIANCITVNADYESVLFHGKKGPPAVNHALEFLAFYLQDLPVLTNHHYSQEFFEKVRKLSGKTPRIVNSGTPSNWWGPLVDPELERWQNSKLTSAALSKAQGWGEVQIVSSNELSELNVTKEMIVKDPFSMSGRGLFVLRPGEITQLKNLPDQLIVEPLLKRRFDFSHFVFPDGKVISYENMVDERFQYRGTLIQPLSFQDKVSPEEWRVFEEKLAIIINHYGHQAPYGYSIDSFVYEDEGKLRIYPLCEVNARRTMGLIAYELGNLLNPHGKSALTLKSPVSEKSERLSPEGTRFEIFFNYV